MMRKYDLPYMADWFAISLRWVILIGYTVSLGLSGKLALFTSLPLALLIVWNLVMTVLTGLNVRVTYHRPVSIMTDLVLAGAFYWTQGGLWGPTFWAGLLPVLTGAIYFEVLGSLIAAVLFSVLVIYTGLNTGGNLTLAIIISASLGVLSLVFGLLSHSMIRSMKGNREQMRGEEERKGHLQTERMRAIYELTLALSSTLSYTRVLESALNISASALNPDPDHILSDPLVGAVMLFKGG